MRSIILLLVSLFLLLLVIAPVMSEDIAAIAGPPLSVGYNDDGPVRIRFSSYFERTPLPESRLYNLPPVTGRGKSNLEQLARIDADEGMVYTPGEKVTIHIKTIAPATLVITGQRNGRSQSVELAGEQTMIWQLEPPGGKDDFELYKVEALQQGKVVARRGFLSAKTTGDVRAVEKSIGTFGWEFIEWAYTPFDIASGFPGHPRSHGPVYDRFDNRLQPWNWVTEIFASDMPKGQPRIADWSKDPFAQPYTDWARWYQYAGADLLAWRPDSWRWGEFNSGDIEGLNWGQGNKRIVGRGFNSLNGKPGEIGQYENYVAANDSVFPNGVYFREWLAQIYYPLTKQACEMYKGFKPRIAEADHWNDRDMGQVPTHTKIIQLYLEYLLVNKLPHDDLAGAKSSAELADLLTKSGTPERMQHYQVWNNYQVNLRGRQYLWEAAVRAAMDVNGFEKADWLYGNGMVGDWLQIKGQGGRMATDYEQLAKPWAANEFQTDWDYGHWQSGSYRFAGQSFARMGAIIGRDILNPDVYNEVVPHAAEKVRNEQMYQEWCVPQTAAEHNRLFSYTSFLHFYDFAGKPQRVVNMPYNDLYRNSWNNCLGVLDDATPGEEVHAILDHRQLSESITMQHPIGFVGVVSSTRTDHQAKGIEYIINSENWPWYFETLVDCGISLPAFIDDQAVDKLPAATSLIFAPRKDGNGNMVISARVAGKMIVRPWIPRDRVALQTFALEVREAAGNPVVFSLMTTGFAYQFQGNQALLYVENMRSATVSDDRRGNNPPPGIKEEARIATIGIDIGTAAKGAMVWDMTAYLPLAKEQVQANGTRLTLTLPLNAGDGRIYIIIPTAAGVTAPAPVLVEEQPAEKYVPWGDTAYEKIVYRNALKTTPPEPYGPHNYTQLAELPAVPAPDRVTADAGELPEIAGTAELLKIIAPDTVVVVGKDAPESIKLIAEKLLAAVRKAGGKGEVITDKDWHARPVAETGKSHVLAVGTVWDNELLQRFNDPWALDRDWYYGRLHNEPAWPWMVKTGYTIGWVGDFAADDAEVGYLCVDRSSYMWEARCKAYDEKRPPEEQMPLRLFIRISGSGPAGVAKAAKAFADDGLLNGCLPGKSAPVGDARYTLTPARCLTELPLKVPQQLDAGDGHTLRYLGWNQADAEEYDGFLSKTGVVASRIIRAKYLPEWGITNFPTSPHRASSRFELCVINCETPAEPIAELLGGKDAKTVQLADGEDALLTTYGTHIVAHENNLILESAPEPWGKALLEAYLALEK